MFYHLEGEKMKNSEIIQTLMFDYDALEQSEILSLCNQLSKKILRWLAMHHPDNRIRKIFFRLTNVEIGEGTVITHNVFVSDNYEPLLKIGKRTCIGWNVSFICNTDFNNSLMQENEYVKSHVIKKAKIIVGDDAWIGGHSVILAGVKIGNGAMVAPGAVVTRDVTEYTIVGGVPARFMRNLINPDS